MTLVKWTPKNNLLNYFNGIDRMFDNVFTHSTEVDNQTSFFKPSLDVVENKLEYLIYLDLPGVDKKDVEVNSSAGILTVAGKRKNIKDEKDKSYVWQEIRYGIFKRSFELPTAIQEDKIKASFKNGVLILKVPKIKEIEPVIKKIAIS